VLRLYRDGDQAFFHLYGALQNRNIRGVRVTVSDETYRLLRDGFEQQRQIQEAEFDQLARAAEDALLLEHFLRERAAQRRGTPDEGLPELSLPAAGFFLPSGGDPIVEAPPSPVLLALGARIVQARGADFLSEREAELARTLAALEPESPSAPSGSGSGEPPAASYGFARRYRDGLPCSVCVHSKCWSGPFPCAQRVCARGRVQTGRFHPQNGSSWLGLRRSSRSGLSLSSLRAGPISDFRS